MDLFIDSGDFGGSMGLYIGASFLTVYEILDVLMSYVYGMLMRRVAKTTPVTSLYWNDVETHLEMSFFDVSGRVIKRWTM